MNANHDTVETEMGCIACHEPVAMVKVSRFAGKQPLHVGPAAEYDHEPDLVPLAQLPQVRYRCDFCSSADPAWLYNTSGDFDTSTVTASYTSKLMRRPLGRHHEVVSKVPDRAAFEDNVSHFYDGWTACRPCADLIELHDVNRLVTRLRRVKGDEVAETRSQSAGRFSKFMALKAGRVPFQAVQTRQPNHGSDLAFLGHEEDLRLLRKHRE